MIVRRWAGSWQWQDHPTRWAPGDLIDDGDYGIMHRNQYGWLSEGPLARSYSIPDTDIDEWIMCGWAVPLVEHGNRMTP